MHTHTSNNILLIMILFCDFFVLEINSQTTFLKTKTKFSD